MKKALLIVLGLLVVLAIVTVFALRMVANSYLNSSLETAQLSLPEGYEVTYEDANYQLLGGKSTIQDVVVTTTSADGVEQDVEIDEVIVHRFDRSEGAMTEDGLPKSAHIEAKGILLSNENDNLEGLAELGYAIDELKIDLEVDYNYAPEDESLIVDTLEVNAPDIFALDMTMDVSGIDPDMDLENDAMGSLSSITINNMAFTYDDKSLMERAMTQSAEEEGISLDQFKENAIADLNSFINSAENERTITMANEMAEFIQNPQQLTLTMAPEDPENLMSLGFSVMFGGDTDQLMEDLNIQIEAN